MTSCTMANAGAAQGFVYLRFASQDVRLHGLTVRALARLGDSAAWGHFTLHGMLGYVRGKDAAHGRPPIRHHAAERPAGPRPRPGRLEQHGRLLMVAAKHVSDLAQRGSTAGYALVNLRTSYEWQAWRPDLGVDNVFNRFLPASQGGAYLGQGATMAARQCLGGIGARHGPILLPGATVKF